MKIETAQTQPKKLIRAVYPNGGDKRGYRIVLTMQKCKAAFASCSLTKWIDKFTPHILGGY
ncbi:MAG TPA: hypothetical protein VHT01_08605 [Candidatus Udaeobacter sp.]|jgi:hypothetical protein|nr:hypothetical protein [Candidatus Udaeobacter sp.]